MRVTDVSKINERPFARRWLRRLWYGALVATLTFLAVEAVVRVLGIAPAIDLRNGWMEQAPGIPYRPRPNSVLSGVAQTGEYSFHHKHNSAGLRDDERRLLKSAGTFRVLGLGDSFTAGWGADFEQTYLRRTEVALNNRAGRHPPIEIVKAGINGYFPTTQRMLLESYGLKYRPDLVLIGFVPNDVFDTAIGADAIVVSKQGWLTSGDAAEIGPLGVWLYVHSHVARISLSLLARGKRSLFFSADWATRIYRPDDEAEAAWQTVTDEYERIDAAVRQAGGRLAIFYIPANPPLTAMHTYPEQRLGAWAAVHDVAFISALPEMRAAMPEEVLYWKKDGHCTPAGYRILAEVLTRELDARGLVP